MRLLVDKNIRLVQILFILLLAGLFFASCRGSKHTVKTSENTVVESTESKALKAKYAVQLGVESKELSEEEKLLRFVDEWYGVPYKYGGKDKNGVDCSSFSCQVLFNVYGKTISGSAQSLYELCNPHNVADLKDGDLVFFKIESSRVTHVGVYITNNKFVHATTKKGVMINDLNEAYYKKYFYSGGRLRS